MSLDSVRAPERRFRLLINSAKAILDATPLTEEELTYLATGALGEGPGTS